MATQLGFYLLVAFNQLVLTMGLYGYRLASKWLTIPVPLVWVGFAGCVLICLVTLGVILLSH